MGFGSYDESDRTDIELEIESEQGNDATSTIEFDHDGEIEYEYGDASSDDLLKVFEEIQEK